MNTPEPHTVGQHTLGPHVVGQRVVVRHLMPDGRATDVLGVCTGWGTDTLTIERDGVGPVTIALVDVVTGKPIPPRASVRARVPARDIELRVASLWEGQESVPLGEWMLRHSPAESPQRPRKRANSALAMGDAGIPLSHATNAVRSFYTDRGALPMVQVQVGSSYERWFTSLGWLPVQGGDAHCQLAPISRALRSCNALFAALPRSSNTAQEQRTPRYKEEGERLEVTIGDGTARGEAALDGDWLGLHGLHVDPAHRGEGMAYAVLAELLDWGASRGATTAWLHVATDNPDALALYDRLGFVTHHTNRYLALA